MAVSYTKKYSSFIIQSKAHSHSCSPDHPHCQFYRKLTFFSYPDEDEQDFKAISLQNNFRDLSAVFQTKEFSKRNAFSVPFTINGFITIGVKGHVHSPCYSSF